jgi:DNA-binding NarL/FixJ family response regulator
MGHNKAMREARTLNVAIVEDDDRFRRSLARWLENTEGVRCSGSYSNAEDALRQIPSTHCDVVIMDINLPGMSGIECVSRLRNERPALQVIMLTVYEDSDLIFKALQAGAHGYLLKRSSPDKILEAINEVSQGGAPMSSNIARKVVQAFERRTIAAHGSADFNHLTKREEEILGGVVRGLINKEIAEELGISVETIRVHLKSIYEKLHVRSRTEAALKAYPLTSIRGTSTSGPSLPDH